VLIARWFGYLRSVDVGELKHPPAIHVAVA
jgi:hypothetical protein